MLNFSTYISTYLSTMTLFSSYFCNTHQQVLFKTQSHNTHLSNSCSSCSLCFRSFSASFSSSICFCCSSCRRISSHSCTIHSRTTHWLSCMFLHVTLHKISTVFWEFCVIFKASAHSYVKKMVQQAQDIIVY